MIIRVAIVIVLLYSIFTQLGMRVVRAQDYVPAPGILCPALVTYDNTFLKELSAERNLLPDGASLGKAIDDYMDLRDTIRKKCKSA